MFYCSYFQFFRCFPDRKIEDVFIGPGVSGWPALGCRFIWKDFFSIINFLDESKEILRSSFFNFGKEKNWNFVIWMKRLETTRRKQKTSAGGSEFKMRNCCKRIELHIKRRQKITRRRRNLNNFYMRLEGYYEASVSRRLLIPLMKGATSSREWTASSSSGPTLTFSYLWRMLEKCCHTRDHKAVWLLPCLFIAKLISTAWN